MNNRNNPNKDEQRTNEESTDEQRKIFEKCFASLTVEEHMILKAYFGSPPSSRKRSRHNSVSDESSNESEIELNDSDSGAERPVKRSRR